MDFEITAWKMPPDIIKIMAGLDAMVALLAKKGGQIYLYDADYKKVRTAAKKVLPEGTSVDRITYHQLEVRNGGTKKAKRPGAKYNPDRIKLR